MGHNLAQRALGLALATGLAIMSMGLGSQPAFAGEPDGPAPEMSQGFAAGEIEARGLTAAVADEEAECWSARYKMTGEGLFEFWADTSWCGDGVTVVSGTTPTCGGLMRVPTSAYEGCSTVGRWVNDDWEVDTVWTVCLAYVPLFGCTGLRAHPQMVWRYYGDGTWEKIKQVDL